MPNTTTQTTIEQLHDVFARWGIPQLVVTDNGPQFQFMNLNSIKHYKSSPYHPATNGLAVHIVQTLKYALRVSWKGNSTT